MREWKAVAAAAATSIKLYVFHNEYECFVYFPSSTHIEEARTSEEKRRANEN